MGSHLRFGFEATYGRDTTSMRDDNAADYPWLCFSLVTLMREYIRLRESQPEGDASEPQPEGARALPASTEGARAFQASADAIIEGIVNGLSPDARAFVGAPPASLSRAEAERAEFRDAFFAHRTDLLAEFERHRPVDGAFSPLSLFFNFSHNVVKGTIVDALLRGEPWPVAFNDLLTGLPMVRVKPPFDGAQGGLQALEEPDVTDEQRPDEQPGPDAREELARTLMTYARENPDRIRGRLMPVIVYDPRAGHRAFRVMMEKLADAPQSPSP
jgi:hypothetical protein